jgi:hypothetical protein
MQATDISNDFSDGLMLVKLGEVIGACERGMDDRLLIGSLVSYKEKDSWSGEEPNNSHALVKQC